MGLTRRPGTEMAGDESIPGNFRESSRLSLTPDSSYVLAPLLLVRVNNVPMRAVQYWHHPDVGRSLRTLYRLSRWKAAHVELLTDYLYRRAADAPDAVRYETILPVRRDVYHDRRPQVSLERLRAVGVDDPLLTR